MKRAKHTLSHYRMHTARMGQLVPITCYPVLPGDTVQQSTDVVIRVTPLNTPVMHPVTVRLHHWYVPNRIIWPESEGGGWENFITGGKDGMDTQTVPQYGVSASKSSVLTYLGIPPDSSETAQVSALPIRGFWKIFNDRYRDQDILPEVSSNTNAALPYIAWEKDYATVARPWAQKGPLVTLPLGDKAVVYGEPNTAARMAGALGQGDLAITAANPGNVQVNSLIGSTNTDLNIAPAGSETNVYADLSTAAQLTINEFREGFALQRYQEARARYGSRFTEYLRYLGITPSDARLQDPEFLGGGSARLQFSEVLQTAPNNPGTDQNGIGDLYGHGIAGARSNTFRKFFEEHGYVFTLLSVRPKAIYQDGVPREFLKKTKEDFFQKELAGLGQQELLNDELHINHNSKGQAFGFTDRYQEYRTGNSQVCNDFRDTLNSWHLARALPTDVALNKDFIDCKPSDRIYQVGHSGGDPLWIMANHRIVARRMVPKRANPRVM